MKTMTTSIRKLGPERSLGEESEESGLDMALIDGGRLWGAHRGGAGGKDAYSADRGAGGRLNFGQREDYNSQRTSWTRAWLRSLTRSFGALRDPRGVGPLLPTRFATPMSAETRRKGLLGRLVTTTFKLSGAVLAALLLLELAFRLMGPSLPDRGPNNRLPIRVAVAPDKAPGLGQTLRPNYVGSVVYPGYGEVPERTVEYAVSSQGFRDREFVQPKPPGLLRIAMIGDSVTYGTGVAPEDTLPKQLERELRARFPQRDLEVMNCGVFAHNTTQQLAWYRFNIAKFEPDVVLVCTTIPDASGENIPPRPVEEETSEARWVRRLGLTSGVWAADDMGDATVALKTTMFLRRNSKLADFVAHQLYNGLMGQAHTQSYRLDWAPGSPGYESVKKAYALFANDARQAGTRFLGAMYPTLVQLDEYPYAAEHAALGAIAEELSVPFLDLAPAFAAEDARALQVHPHDHHPNPTAHGIAAEALADFVVAELTR
jgi:lysophospholipase L1-like esterase